MRRAAVLMAVSCVGGTKAVDYETWARSPDVAPLKRGCDAGDGEAYVKLAEAEPDKFDSETVRRRAPLAP